MLGFQILGIIFGSVLAIVIFVLLRAGMLREKYSLIWLFVSVFIVIISLFRGLLEKIADLAGVEYAPSALFAFLLCAAFVLLLNTSVSLSSIKKNNKVLIQRLGLLEFRVNELIKMQNRQKDDEKEVESGADAKSETGRE